MVMKTKTFRDVFDADFLMAEGPGRLSREQGIIAANAAAKPSGLILGQITATSKYVPLNLGANDGSQNAAAILMLRQGESPAKDQRAAIVARLAEVRGLNLTYPVGASGPQKKAIEAQLALKMIIVRY